MLWVNGTDFTRISTDARWSKVMNMNSWSCLVHALQFSFYRSNLQRWEDLADDKPQLTRTNYASITTGTLTDDLSDSSRTPPANNIRQPASTWYAVTPVPLSLFPLNWFVLLQMKEIILQNSVRVSWILSLFLCLYIFFSLLRSFFPSGSLLLLLLFLHTRAHKTMINEAF